jgi:TRAP-type C4-dicarboxylate transport system permease small subunit
MGNDSPAVKFQNILSRINKIAAITSGILVVIIMLMTVVEVVGRYAFNSPTSWSIELSGYLLLISVFLAASYTLEKRGHVQVDVFIDMLPKKTRFAIAVITAILAIVFSILLLWQTSKLTFDAFSLGWVSNTVLKIVLYPFYLAMPVGCALLIAQALSDLALLGSKRKTV